MADLKGVQYPTVDDVLPLALDLTPADKLKLIQQLAAAIADEVTPLPQKPKESLLGLWADAGIDLSEEEIDELRREAWGGVSSAGGGS
jgi:hypothetical protein